MDRYNSILTKEAVTRLKRLAGIAVGKILKSKPITRTLNLAKKYPKTSLIAGGVALGGGDIAKELVYDPIKLKSDQLNAYGKMESKVPSLKNMNEQKKKDYFSVLTTYSPSLARNPYVAGNLVNKMNEFGGPDHKLVQDIIGMEKNIESGSGSLQRTLSRIGAIGAAAL